MVTPHWGSHIGACVCKVFTKSSRAISSGFKDVRKWLFEPFRADQRLYFAAKLTAIAIGTAFVWFFGWRGITLAQDGVKATIQSNKLSAKQVCTNANLTAGDCLWSDDFNRNVPLSSVIKASDWITASPSSTKLSRRSDSDEPIYSETFSVGMLACTIMYSAVSVLRSLYYYTGQSLLYFAVVAAARWKGKRDESKYQERKMT